MIKLFFRKNNFLFLIETITVTLIVFAVTWTTFSALSYAGVIDANSIVSQRQENVTDSIQAFPRHSRAPEPSTLVLFGSGLIGMIVSFVRRVYLLAKRCIDIFLSVFALIILSPVIFLTAVASKCSSRGPIFFQQLRVGKGGRQFYIFKFRTMKVDAEKETGAIWAKDNDPRLIPIGKFIRKAHIDEIPQFINVIRGEMSVVGPRPERPIFVEKLRQVIPDYEKRLSVKPGITGLAQVWHKYDETIEDVRKKIKYDLLYIKTFCLWTDLSILFRTVRVVFTGEGAR